MARVRSVMARGLSLVQLTWPAVLTLVVAVSSVADGPAAVLGAAVALVLLLAVTGHGARQLIRLIADSASGPRRDEKRLRGAFRRQSAPDAPGRPLPRAPGRVPAAA